MPPAQTSLCKNHIPVHGLQDLVRPRNEHGVSLLGQQNRELLHRERARWLAHLLEERQRLHGLALRDAFIQFRQCNRCAIGVMRWCIGGDSGWCSGSADTGARMQLATGDLTLLLRAQSLSGSWQQRVLVGCAGATSAASERAEQ